MLHLANALEIFNKRRAAIRLPTGMRELDALLGGGLESGFFYLFYGDETVDSLIHSLMVNALDETKLKARVLYLNCGNYREEKTILDGQLLSSLMKRSGMDPLIELDRIQVLCAFSDEQQEDIVERAQKYLGDNPNVRLVIVHHIAKLFTSRQASRRERLERIQRLQHVVSEVWRTAAERNVFFAASCRPSFRKETCVPEPEGGRYLRHLASVIIYLRRLRKPEACIAHLVKHPSLESRRIMCTLNFGGEVLGRITLPFNTVLKELVNKLKANYLKALKEPSRREAFKDLLGVWSSERGAMNNVEIPTVLDSMLLTAILDNRRIIREIYSRLEKMRSDMEEVKKLLKIQDLGK